ncbi:MAG: hypothetical protein P9M08_04055 [Candidatus Erginobacter occultus]|nr:hypothetical protein [Candidatus Erginobacter occultus]
MKKADLRHPPPARIGKNPSLYYFIDSLNLRLSLVRSSPLFAKPPSSCPPKTLAFSSGSGLLTLKSTGGLMIIREAVKISVDAGVIFRKTSPGDPRCFPEIKFSTEAPAYGIIIID